MILISLSGIDGSGKTTLIKFIKEHLQKFGICVKYRHEYDYFILKYFLKIIGTKRVNRLRNNMLKRKISLLHKLWPLAVYMDYIIFYIYVKLFYPKCVMIMDRNIIDHYLSFKYLGIMNKLYEFLYMHAPKPDVIVVLTVDPKIAYERKKYTHPYPISYYVNGIIEYNYIANKINIPIIDTSKHISACICELYRIMLSKNKILKKLFNIMLENRTLYSFVNYYKEYCNEHAVEKENNLLKCISKEYLVRENRFLKSLMFLKEIVPNEMVIIKTVNPYFKYIPTYDIDVLFPISKFLKILPKLWPKYSNYISSNEEEYKINIRIPGIYVISIHGEISWDGLRVFNKNTIFQRSINYCIYNNRFSSKRYCFLIPDPLSDLIIRIAHIIFETSFITYIEAKTIIMDLLSLNSKDFIVLYELIKDYGWFHEFLATLHFIIKSYKEFLQGHLSFPVALPYIIHVRAFLKTASSQPAVKGLSKISVFKLTVKNLSRFLIWRVGRYVLGRAPFGDIIRCPV